MRIVRTPGPGAKILEVALQNLQGKVGKVGWAAQSKYPNGTPVAYVATIQEYGDPGHGIPPRPTGRPTIAAKQEEWKAIALSGSKAIFHGEQTIGGVMENIGQKARGDWQKAIATLVSPPLSPKTIAARLHARADKKTVGLLTKPLIDTSLMFTTLTNVVEDE